MLAIEVELLTGRYAASAHDDRERHEWPPHPARLFSALVAEWGGAEAPDPAEHMALEEIERLGAPQLRASGAAERSVVTHYVPVNDPTVIGSGPSKRAERIDQAYRVLGDDAATVREKSKAERAIVKERDVRAVVSGAPNQSNPLPSARGRQARYYPSVTPDIPLVTYVWPDADLGADVIRTIDGLLSRVTRLGHSSSLVSCRLADAPQIPSHVPDADGSLALRTVSAGQLSALKAEYARHGGSRSRSLPASITRYASVRDDATPADQTVLPTTAGELIVFELRSKTGARAERPGPRHVVGLASALRGALLAQFATNSQVPEALSGHRESGAVTTRPHVAFVALPDVGQWRSHGGILGVGVLLPHDIEDVERRAVLAAIGRWEDEHPGSEETALTIQGGRRWAVSRLTRRSPLVGLRERRWSAPSRTWASATPVALPWRAGRGRGASEWDLMDDWIAKACAHVGLPAPAQIAATVAPALSGTLPASRYPAFRQGGTARRLVHVTVTFSELVGGPFVLGSGRFRGLGLMRPIQQRQADGD